MTASAIHNRSEIADSIAFHDPFFEYFPNNSYAFYHIAFDRDVRVCGEKLGHILVFALFMLSSRVNDGNDRGFRSLGAFDAGAVLDVAGEDRHELVADDVALVVAVEHLVPQMHDKPLARGIVRQAAITTHGPDPLVTVHAPYPFRLQVVTPPVRVGDRPGVPRQHGLELVGYPVHQSRVGMSAHRKVFWFNCFLWFWSGSFFGFGRGAC